MVYVLLMLDFEYDRDKFASNLEKYGIGVTRQSIIILWLVERLEEKNR